MSPHPWRMNIEGPLNIKNLDWLLLVNRQRDREAWPMAMSDARLEQLADDVRSGTHQRTSILMRHVFEVRFGLRIDDPAFPGGLETHALQKAFGELVVQEQEARRLGGSCEGARDEFEAMLDATCRGRRKLGPRSGEEERAYAPAWPNADVADIMATNEALRITKAFFDAESGTDWLWPAGDEQDTSDK